MRKQEMLTILFISFLEIFGQNIKYLRSYDSNSTNMNKVGIISNNSKLKTKNYESLNNKNSNLFDEERMKLLDIGETWDRFLHMSIVADPKKSTLKKTSSNKISSKQPLTPLSRITSQPNTETPIASDATDQILSITPTEYQAKTEHIKSVIPTTLQVSKITSLPTTLSPTSSPSESTTAHNIDLTTSPTIERLITVIPSHFLTHRPIIFPTYSPSKSHPVFNNAVTRSKCDIEKIDERKIAIKKILKQFSLPVEYDKDSIENQALQWIVAQDEACSIIDHNKVTQRYILALFYFATSGDSWSKCNQSDKKCRKKSFLSSKSECDWFGIRCNQDGFVKNIYFDDNNLTGIIPSELGYLNSLQTLTLTKGHLTSTIPNTIGNLENLRVLHLCENKLSGSIPSEVYNLHELEALQLSYNQIKDTLNPAIGNLTNLRILQLQSNQFSRRVPRELKDLTYLEILELQENDLVGNIPSRMCSLLFSNDGALTTLASDCAGDIPAVSCECCTSC